MSRSMAIRAVFRGAYLRRAIVVAIVVGTALNLINQPEVLFGTATVVWWKVLMTYSVPFLVASYGAYSALRNNPA